MTKSIKLLMALAIIAGIALCAVPALADQWDVTASFGTTGTATSTDGMWSHGYFTGSNPGSYTFTQFTYHQRWWAGHQDPDALPV